MRLFNWLFKQNEDALNQKREVVDIKNKIMEDIIQRRLERERRFHDLPIAVERRVSDA